MSADYRSQVEEAVRQERNAQDEKWGEQNHLDERWLVILMEEVGEVAEAILRGDRDSVFAEYVQVAAVAQAALECRIRHGHPPTGLNIRRLTPEEAAAKGCGDPFVEGSYTGEFETIGPFRSEAAAKREADRITAERRAEWEASEDGGGS